MTTIRAETIARLRWPESHTFVIRLPPIHNINDRKLIAADRAYSKLRQWAVTYMAPEMDFNWEPRWITEMEEYEEMKAAVMVLYNSTSAIGRDRGFLFFEGFPIRCGGAYGQTCDRIR